MFNLSNIDPFFFFFFCLVFYLIINNLFSIIRIIRGMILDILDFLYLFYDIIKTIIIFIIFFSIFYFIFHHIVFKFFFDFTCVKILYYVYSEIRNFAFIFDLYYFYEIFDSYTSLQKKLDFKKIENLNKEFNLLKEKLEKFLIFYSSCNEKKRKKIDSILLEYIAANPILKEYCSDGIYSGFLIIKRKIEILNYLNKLAFSIMMVNFFFTIINAIIVLKLHFFFLQKMKEKAKKETNSDPVTEKINELIDFGILIWHKTPFYKYFIILKNLLTNHILYKWIKKFLIFFYIYDYFIFIKYLFNEYMLVRFIILHIFLFFSGIYIYCKYFI